MPALTPARAGELYETRLIARARQAAEDWLVSHPSLQPGPVSLRRMARAHNTEADLIRAWLRFLA